MDNFFINRLGIQRSHLFSLSVIVGVLFGFSTQLYAQDVAVAILDRGIDVKDPRIEGKTIDGFGWNTFLQNAQVYTPRASVAPEVEAAFKRLNDLKQLQFSESRKPTAAEVIEEDSLLKKVCGDQFNEYFSHMHGQHVAGIVLEGTIRTKILPVTFLPEASDQKNLKPIPLDQFWDDTNNGLNLDLGQDIDPRFLERLPEKYYGLIEVKRPLFVLSEYFTEHFLNGIDYVTTRKVQLVNMSIDSGMRHMLAKAVGDAWGKHFFSSPPADVWTNYVQEVQRYMSAVFYQRLMANRDKLFILAAGNSEYEVPVLNTDSLGIAREGSIAGTHIVGNNNDLDPNFPTSVVAFYNPSNVLVVAATNERKSLVYFSGFGAKTVHVAAPGVNVESYAIGGGTYHETGTSQAAPYVTNTAAKMLEINRNLVTKQIRTIIIETVDKKDFLKGKVSSEGIVNPVRAQRAAELLKGNITLEQAVAQAREEVKDL